MNMITYITTKCKEKIDGITINIPADEFELHNTQAEIKIELYHNKSQLKKLIYIELTDKDKINPSEIQNLNYIYTKIKYKNIHIFENSFAPEFENNLMNNIINIMYECFHKHKNFTIFPYKHHVSIELISQALKAYINSNAYKEIDNIMNKKEIIKYGL